MKKVINKYLSLIINIMDELLHERELPHDYPVHCDYLYVADGKVIRSWIEGDINSLRIALIKDGINCNVITNCDIMGRELMSKASNDFDINILST